MPIPSSIADAHRHILILDDESMMTRLFEKSFVKHKDRYAVHVANNPVDALVIIGKKLPHLLVMDLMMPVMDGFQVCQVLKSNPATKAMKIVAISGKKLSASQQDFLRQNCDKFLQKPFAMNDLVSMIDKLLN